MRLCDAGTKRACLFPEVCFALPLTFQGMIVISFHHQYYEYMHIHGAFLLCASSAVLVYVYMHRHAHTCTAHLWRRSVVSAYDFWRLALSDRDRSHECRGLGPAGGGAYASSALTQST